MDTSLPSSHEIREAQTVLARHLPRTPLYLNPALSREVGFKVWVKYENHLPPGSFKPRGAIYHLHCLRKQGVQGVATASTGNHGMGVTFAAKALGMKAVIVIPQGTDPIKITRLRDFGADIRTKGHDLRESCEHCQDVAKQEGLVYVEDGEDRGLMVGAATLAAEILDERPEIEAIFVPVGGGNLIGAICSAVAALRPGVKVIGVQSEAAPAAFLSWQKKEWVLHDRCETFAGGLATRNPGRFAFSVYGPRVNDFVLVSEAELRRAIVGMLDATGFVAEGAAAAPLAACRRYSGRWSFRNACFLFTGGNLSISTLAEILAAEP